LSASEESAISFRNAALDQFAAKSTSLNLDYFTKMNGEPSLYDKGKETRIAVLGEAHVQRSLAARQSEFAKPLQDFTTEFCWGKVWSRPELDRRSRSLVSMSIVPFVHRVLFSCGCQRQGAFCWHVCLFHPFLPMQS
jgi:hypothetical protein